MTKFVDFRALKETVSIEQVLDMLGLDLKRTNNQLRGCCPIHDGNSPREFVVTPSKGLFYCFGSCGGGDMIKLVAKVHGLSQRDAAIEIAEHFGNCTVTDNSTVTEGTVPASRGKDADRSFQPLSYLEADHEAVDAVGFDVETADALGIGYAKKGIMRGTVAVPVRLPDGTLAGYIGITEARLPPRWQLPNENVVPLHKKRKAS